MTICSLVVYAQPEKAPEIENAIAAMGGAEVHSVEGEGKLIVVLDHADRTYCSKTIMDMNNIDGVISTSLVYENHE